MADFVGLVADFVGIMADYVAENVSFMADFVRIMADFVVADLIPLPQFCAFSIAIFVLSFGLGWRP